MSRAVRGGSVPRRRSAKGPARRSRRATGTAAIATAGARASAAWLKDRHLGSSKPWYVEIALDVADRPVSITYSGDTDSRFHLNIYPEEWSVFFCHGSRASWVRVTDEAFVHGRDEHNLKEQLPELHQIGYLLHAIEQRYRVRFRRDHALIRTNLTAGQRAIRDWLVTV